MVHSGRLPKYILGDCMFQYMLVDCCRTFRETVEVHARGLHVAVDCCTFREIVEVHARGLHAGGDCTCWGRLW